MEVSYKSDRSKWCQISPVTNFYGETKQITLITLVIRSSEKICSSYTRYLLHILFALCNNISVNTDY